MRSTIWLTLAALAAAAGLFLTPLAAQHLYDVPPNAPVVKTAASSGNVAAATATATLAATVDRRNYICGFSITSSGSTAAAVVSATVTGVTGGTMTFTYTSVAGVTLKNDALVVDFSVCIQATADNTAIAVSLPSLGAGNTNATVNAWGYRL